MKSAVSIRVTEAMAGRVDKAVATAYPSVGRKRLSELFADGKVRIDGKKAKKGDWVEHGQTIELAHEPVAHADEVPLPDPEAAAALTILLDTEAFVAVAKPAGMPSQPLRAGELGTVANGLAHLYPACAALGDDPRDGGLVHRLDAGTSGVLLAAKTPNAYRALRGAFTSGDVHKEYLALIAGRLVVSECANPLAQRGNHVVADHAAGLSAYTEFTAEATSATHTLVRCIARSGRMHQIRAHLAQCETPIVGDILYGGTLDERGFFLHAATLRFTLDGTSHEIVAPLPEAAGARLGEAGLTPGHG